MKKILLAPLALLFSLLLGIFFSYFFVEQSYGISVPIFFGMFLGSLFVLKYVKMGAKAFSLYDILFLPLFLLSLGFAYHQTDSLLVANALIILVSIIPLSYFSLYSEKFPRFSFLNGFLSYFHNLAGGIVAIPAMFSGLFLSSGAIRKKSQSYTRYLLHAVIGCIITIPILGVFTALLASADDAFKDLISKVHFDINGLQIFFTILVALTALYFFMGLLLAKIEAFAIDQNYEGDHKKGLSSIITMVVFFSTNFLFITFIIVQFVYLFGNHDKVVDLGLTYSEYAVHGFWELQAVSVLALIMLYIFKRLTSVNSNQAKIVVNALLSIFIINVLVIIYSAHSRMNLYESGYGYTQLRLYAHVFMGFEALLFAYLFAINLYRPLFKHFSLYFYVLALTFLIVMNVLVPDRIIAQRNIHRYQKDHKELDVEYLLSLSSDSYLQLKDVDFANKDLYTCELLSKRALLKESHDSWGEFNYSKYHADKEIKKITRDYSDEKCNLIITSMVENFFKKYSDSLESGDYSAASKLFEDESDRKAIEQMADSSLNITKYDYNVSIAKFYDHDYEINNDYFHPAYYSSFPYYMEIENKIYYSTEYYSNQCSRDYTSLTLNNSEIKIYSSRVTNLDNKIQDSYYSCN